MTSDSSGRAAWWIALSAPICLAALAAPFAWYAADQGAAGLTGGGTGWFRFSAAGAGGSTTAIFVHMAAGGLITLLAPLQMIGAVRRRWPLAHKAAGYLMIIGALIACVGGLAYIGLRSTVGGRAMDIAFAIYGLLMLLAAVQTLRCDRARRMAAHRVWASRLIVLVMGSWLYRVQYGIWEAATGGLGMAPGFSGPFDLFQLYGFYVPWLIALELWFWRERRRRRQPPRCPASSLAVVFWRFTTGSR